MQFFIISHFFFIKVSLDIKMGLCFLEKNSHRKSEISFLPSLKAKLLFPVCNGTPCNTHMKNILVYIVSVYKDILYDNIKSEKNYRNNNKNKEQKMFKMDSTY